MTKYEELRDEIVKVVPELDIGKTLEKETQENLGIKISYGSRVTPIQLADVLRWVISEVNPGKSGDVLSFFFCFYVGDDGFEFHEENKWDLTKDLEGQSEDVINFLLSLKND